MTKTMQAMLDHLRATPGGATKVELAAVLPVGPQQIDKLVRVMVSSNAIGYVIVGGAGKDNHTRRYYAHEHRQLDDKAMPVAARRTKQRTAPVRLVGEERITSETKVTVAPPFEDKRFRVDSAPRVVDSAECREWARGIA